MWKEIFESFEIGSLKLKNKIIRAGCFEGMYKNGTITDELINYHLTLAKGGCGMTTIAYAAVSKDGLSFENELCLGGECLEDLKRMTKTIHGETDCKVSIQLSHSGYFSSPEVIGTKPIGASKKMSFCREMKEKDFKKVLKSYANAAVLVKRAEIDCIELHAGHGYLLSQFLSPFTNRRKDKYGGSLENRVRFPCQVIREIRKAVGEEFPIVVKMNLYDNVPGGVTIDESVKIAQAFEKEGVDAIIPSCGFTSYSSCLDMLTGYLPLKEMVKNRKRCYERVGLRFYGKYMVKIPKFQPLFLRNGALKIRAAVKIPVIYVGGINSRENMVTLLKDGFGGFQVGRWLINDPEFPNRMMKNEIEKSSCYRCNQCITAMERDHGLCCMIKRKRRLGIKHVNEKSICSCRNIALVLLILIISLVLMKLML